MKRNNSKYLLGIDVGTSACKVNIFKLNGTIVASSAKSYNVYYPQVGYVEQDPDEWWRSICTAIKECLSFIDPRQIVGIGIDGQSWSCIPIDAYGKVLARTPIWMDTRANEICRQVNRKIGETNIFNVAKNPFQPSYTTPKILWFEQNNPEIYKNTKMFLQSNSYIVYKLTGELTQDKSQGYGLHVFNIEKGCYDEILCQELGVDINKLPPIYECDDIVGMITKEGAAQTGLKVGTPVVAGGLDAACGTLGAGVYLPGQTQEQGGQAGGMSICVDAPIGNEALILSNHVVPGLWLLQGGSVGGGGCLRWVADNIGYHEIILAKESGISHFDEVGNLAGTIGAGSNGLIFLPYLSGERSPIWDNDACGVFFGLRFDITRAHMYRAVMEGVAYALKHNIMVAENAGVIVKSMNSTGGAANSDIWMQIKADVTGKTMHVAHSDSSTSLGAAILAGVGIGLYTSYKEAIETTTSITKTYTPREEQQGIYNQYFDIYLQIYKDLKNTMHKNNNLNKTLKGK